MQRSWRDLIAEIVDALPAQFELRDVIKHADDLSRHYPANKHIDAKIRQTLQILRDQGRIKFEGQGKYSQSKPNPHFSPLLDFSVAEGFTSRAQIARLCLETWAEFNLYCLSCEANDLIRLPANTPVADFECGICSARYQLKGKDGRFAGVISGAAHAPTISAIRAGSLPNFVLVEYDLRFSTIVFGTVISGPQITEDRVVARAPLAATARRRGWVGCNLRIEGLPHVPIVSPQFLDAVEARRQWATLLADAKLA